MEFIILLNWREFMEGDKEKPKKKWHEHWWVWVISFLIILGAGFMVTNLNDDSSSETANANENVDTNENNEDGKTEEAEEDIEDEEVFNDSQSEVENNNEVDTGEDNSEESAEVLDIDDNDLPEEEFTIDGVLEILERNSGNDFDISYNEEHNIIHQNLINKNVVRELDEMVRGERSADSWNEFVEISRGLSESISTNLGEEHTIMVDYTIDDEEYVLLIVIDGHVILDFIDHVDD